MPEYNREDGVHVKEVVARVNAAAAVGIAAALLGVGGYLLVGGDGVSPSGSTPSIESPEDAAPRSAADIDTRPPGVSLPAAEAPMARTPDDYPNLGRSVRGRSAEAEELIALPPPGAPATDPPTRTPAAYSRLYWVNSDAGEIQRSNLDGSQVQTIVSGLEEPTGIALDVGSGKVYWTEWGSVNPDYA